MAQKVIFALTLVALVVLYMAMRSSLNAPDPTRMPSVASIHAVIEQTGQRCDSVDSFRRLESDNDGWNYYLARCHDGGRYVYFQNPGQRKLGAMSCNAEQAKGYSCPE